MAGERGLGLMGGGSGTRRVRARGRCLLMGSPVLAPRPAPPPGHVSQAAGAVPTKSTAAVAPKRSVLSVSARKIKDNAADWHNLMMKWETLNNNGFSTANKIVNLKIGTQFKDNKLEIECDNIASDCGKLSPDYNEELEMFCAELLGTLENMAKIQLKMEKLCSTTKGICDLETYHYENGDCRTPLFHTWPTTYFYEVSFKLTEMYKKELRLKQTIVQEIAHTADQDLMMVYLSSWLYQPYIENSNKLLLESMLLETGHRQV